VPTLRKLYKSRNRPSQRAIPKVQTDFFASNTSIVSEKLQNSTHPTKDLSQSYNCGKLASLVEEQRLTDCLEYLEKLGYTGDLALSMLALIQTGGAA